MVYKPISIGLVGNSSKEFIIILNSSFCLKTDFDRVSWKPFVFDTDVTSLPICLQTDFDRVSWKPIRQGTDVKF